MKYITYSTNLSDFDTAYKQNELYIVDVMNCQQQPTIINLNVMFSLICKYLLDNLSSVIFNC